MSEDILPPKTPTASSKANVFTALFSPREEIVCRHCGSTDVRPSHKASRSSEYAVYRCRTCKQHFKVVSARPRIHAYLSIGVFLLILGGVAASFIMSSDPEAEYQPRIDARDPIALSKVKTGAQQGDPQAQYDLGLTYWRDANYAEALPLLRAAATAGHADAQYLMGMAYLNGQGIVQNYRDAMEYFNKAAQQGHLEAEYRLGIFHRDGLSTSQDREQAYAWLNVAAAKGHPDALAARDRLAMAMTGEQIVRAQETSAQLHDTLSGKNSAPALPAANQPVATPTPSAGNTPNQPRP